MLRIPAQDAEPLPAFAGGPRVREPGDEANPQTRPEAHFSSAARVPGRFEPPPTLHASAPRDAPRLPSGGRRPEPPRAKVRSGHRPHGCEDVSIAEAVAAST